MAGSGGMSAAFLAMAEEFLQKDPEHVPANPKMPWEPAEPVGQALTESGSTAKAKAAPPWRAAKRVVRPDDVSTSPPRCSDKRPVSPVRRQGPAQIDERKLLEQWADHRHNQWLDDQEWAEQLAEHAEHRDSQASQQLPSSGSWSENVASTNEADDDGVFDMDLDWEDAAEEREAAIRHGIRWRQRGPAPPESPTEYWKGQRYRWTTQRWSRRGGRKRGFWDLVYAAMREGASREQAIEHANKLQSEA